MFVFTDVVLLNLGGYFEILLPSSNMAVNAILDNFCHSIR
jgi:hypothetical protein